MPKHAARPAPETDLYPPIKAYLEAQGYRVKGEIRDCDMVAVRGDEASVIVELKARFGLDLLLQAVARQRMSDAVYIAFPADAGALFRRRRREAASLCRRLGLGVILVSQARGRGGAPLVSVVLDPTPYRPRQDARRRALLLGEFERRRGDPTPGGGRGRPIMTAYRQSALVCARHIAEHGPSRPAAIKAETGVDAAGRILLKDVYGWFERVDRGVYALSERGRQALETFRPATAELETPAA